MKAARVIAVFTDRFPLLGPLVWILSVQYFAAQISVAAAWPDSHHYSWAHNLISDLGNTACGPYAGRYVCSPQQGVMNASFVMLGVTMALGSLLIYQEFRRSRATLIGFSLMALAGFGTILVGAFPENTISQLHAIGAFLALGIGNIGLIVLALAIKQARQSFRVYTFLSGIVSLTAFVLFIAHAYLGLGPGTIERLASYPQTTWLILLGLYMSGTRLRAITPRTA
ncbi:MAG TPA: DUF998 domain-containing protein [Candidatus Saccharimonadales bacterium]|nr:DUF998 domain-containing protein [Candidatus Saccharimonadales bacterium]